MKSILLKEMLLADALDVRKGITALVGGGGKTSAMLRLASELSARGSVIVTTTTHIFPPDTMPALYTSELGEIAAALKQTQAVCVAAPAENGKLGAPELSIEALQELADYVLVEADGSKRLPLKAPADHEPVIPQCAGCVIAVAGLDGLNKQIMHAAFRPERYAALLCTDTAHLITPKDAAEILCSESGQYKNVRAGMRYCILLNKADDDERIALAREVCDQLDKRAVERVVVARLQAAVRSNATLQA